MKTIKFFKQCLLAAIAAIMALPAQSQNFLSTDKIWIYFYHQDHHTWYDDEGKVIWAGPGDFTDYFKVGEDSLINGLIYKKILATDDADMQNWKYRALLREEGSKIFIKNQDEAEDLLYDFGLQEKESFTHYKGGVPIVDVLESIRDTIIGEVERKVYVFSKHPASDPDWTAEEIWIEGIGSLLRGLLRTDGAFFAGASNNVALTCLFQNGELIYHNPEFERCYYYTAPGNIDDIKTVNVSTVTLARNSPNPFSAQTEIGYVLPLGFRTAELKVFDLQGRLLKTCPLDASGVLQLQVPELQTGVYAYSLVVDGRTMATKRMVVVK
jgi:hypothetical protein